ncbi:hypothetical protein WQO_00200 [Streptomyces globisporus C-1027]|uniref:Uncharacterized protein n=1 Tax=Streptomyces globisporus C-1027 TaxID=1172567 RepID=A0A0U3LHZ0_STRGL|nr:hypothetical protein [Streptomyces globisporus]ALU91929.1 hypothetical protein WQO_00200 [Streptomyces globisporus C-1027]
MADLRLWIYGTYHDDPNPRTPTPGPVYVQLVGGPLDRQLLDVTSFTPDERAYDELLISPHGAYGHGDQSDYEPRDDPDRWEWQGDTT